MQRIAVVGLTLALTAVAAVAQERADDFPSRPLRLMIGFPPGSAADITARLVGGAMSQTLGQQLVVESRPGAGSSIAAEFVARAPADGYTLFIGTSSNVTNAAISSNLRFDFAKDLAPVTPLTGLPLILAVHPSLGVSSVKELIALAKSKPGELTYASVGPGTVPHLSSELFSVRTNVKLVHVPYQGSPPAVTDLLGGRVSMMLGVASTIMPHVEAGRLKALASGFDQARAHRAEPADHGRGRAARLRGQRLVRSDGARRHAARGDREARRRRQRGAQVGRGRRQAPRQAFEPLGGAPEEFARFIAREGVKWSAAAEAAGLKK